MKKFLMILTIVSSIFVFSGCSASDMLSNTFGTNTASTIEIHEITEDDYTFETYESSDGYKYEVAIVDFVKSMTNDTYTCYIVRSKLLDESNNNVDVAYFKSTITRKDVNDLMDVVELRDEYTNNGENYSLYANCIEESLAMSIQSLCSGTEKERLAQFRYYLTDGLNDSKKVAEALNLFDNEIFLSDDDSRNPSKYVEKYATAWSYEDTTLRFDFYDPRQCVGYKIVLTQAFGESLNVLSVLRDDLQYPEKSFKYSTVVTSYDELRSIGVLSQCLLESQIDPEAIGLSQDVIDPMVRETLVYFAGEFCENISVYYNKDSESVVICDKTSADYESVYSMVDFDQDGVVTAKENAMASLSSLRTTTYQLMADLGLNIETSN